MTQIFLLSLQISSHRWLWRNHLDSVQRFVWIHGKPVLPWDRQRGTRSNSLMAFAGAYPFRQTKLVQHFLEVVPKARQFTDWWDFGKPCNFSSSSHLPLACCCDLSTRRHPTAYNLRGPNQTLVPFVDINHSQLICDVTGVKRIS